MTHTFVLTLNTLKKEMYICGYYNTYNNCVLLKLTSIKKIIIIINDLKHV